MQMPTLGRRIHILMLLTASVMLAGYAHADPIYIATVQAAWVDDAGQFHLVDLVQNPSAVLGGTRFVDPGPPPVVRRNVTLDAILAFRQFGPETLRATFEWPKGWAPPLSFLVQQGPIAGADAVGFGMDFPIVYHPHPVTMTLSQPGVPGGGIVGPSTFTFSVVSPAPEPSSIVLWSAALLAAMFVRRRWRGLMTARPDQPF